MTTIFRDKVTAGPANEVTFNDAALKPAGAVVWGLDTLEGWDRTPEIDFISTSLGGSVDGEVAAAFAPARARHLLVAGYCMASSRAAAASLYDVLVRDAFPRNREILLTRYEPVPKFLRVRVSAPRQIDPVGPTNFRWVAELTAVDPFRYGLTVISGSAGVAGQSSGGRTYPRTYPLEYATVTEGSANSVTLVNEGTAGSFPFATLHGPIEPGWRLSNDTTDKAVQFDIGLGSGDELEIDFRQGTARLNGFPITALITGDFWEVEPGPNIIRLYGTFDPSASFDISANSAWE